MGGGGLGTHWRPVRTFYLQQWRRGGGGFGHARNFYVQQWVEAVGAVRGGGVGGEGGGGAGWGAVGGGGLGLEACKNFQSTAGPVRGAEGGAVRVGVVWAEGVWARIGGLRTFYLQQ